MGKEERLSIEENVFTKNRPYSAGAFSFEFKIWDRDNENLKQIADETNSIVRNVKKDLDDLCGISIYRDNIRVLPYGNQNNDWVRLDLRRVNNPTLRLSNNQIVGFVSIGLTTNPELKDQSNREGIVESEAFEDLKEYVKLILNEVEQRRYKERPRENDYSKERTNGSVFEHFSMASIKQEIQEKQPSSEQVLDLIDQKESEIQEAIVKVQEIISRYRRLSTLGLLIDPILHDGGNLLNKIELKAVNIVKEAQKGDCNLSKVVNKATEIKTLKSEFTNLYKRIEPFGGRKRGRPQTIVVEDIIRDQFMICKEELEQNEIKYDVSKTEHKVTIDVSELAIVLMNLLQNSIYWLSTVSTNREISIEVADTTDGLEIIVSDSGPGVMPGDEEIIFQPYYSTKPNGIGLGLTIVGEIMAEYDGELSLLKEGVLGGASFRLLFRKRI